VSKRRVVVTGLGMVTPVGNDVASTWANIKNGVSGIAPIDRFDTSAFTTTFGGAVKDLDTTSYMPAKEAKRNDLFIQYGMIAGMQAIEDAGLSDSETDADRIGFAVGSGIGGISSIESGNELINTRGPRKISPFFVPGSIINMIAGNLAIKYGYKGPNIAIVTACTTGTHNIGMAGRMITHGDADVMIAGGAEMATSPVGLGGFAAARALSTRNDDPQAASRPWDVDRDGFVLSDGAGVLVLEEYERAKARGATIYAELTGFGMSDDAYHMTSPPENGEGAQASMQAALKDSGLNGDQINYVNAHGTSTPAGDVAEARAVAGALGEEGASKVAMSSTKSMIGHLLGAAGSVEAIFSVLAIRDQVAPPTINLDNQEPEIKIDLVAHAAQERSIDHAMSNSFGFGGTNGTLIFSKA